MVYTELTARQERHIDQDKARPHRPGAEEARARVGRPKGALAARAERHPIAGGRAHGHQGAQQSLDRSATRSSERAHSAGGGVQCRAWRVCVLVGQLLGI